MWMLKRRGKKKRKQIWPKIVVQRVHLSVNGIIDDGCGLNGDEEVSMYVHRERLSKNDRRVVRLYRYTEIWFRLIDILIRGTAKVPNPRRCWQRKWVPGFEIYLEFGWRSNSAWISLVNVTCRNACHYTTRTTAVRANGSAWDV